MNINKSLSCPNCNSNDFLLKYEAKYVYVYKIDTSNFEDINKTSNVPFLFDTRDKADSNQYIECMGCKNRYKCDLEHDHEKIDFTILQKAIRSDYIENPEFFG
ncbi:MAG: hypothetical protein N4A48_10085 [Tepidibacter sp.]|uniref:hypothetical protein n=1 Tax=Tepidibacter sp. TaxID=2529387 RepID=UPI0025DD1ED1|nr:hypothetical protein [Tepidibacter sp.]MCT4509089.1 hypothetical protein [Tepidibacter sp.]